MATTETMFPDQSDFDYDYETLRTTGVILAVIMFVSGILIALIPAPLVPKFQRQRFLLKLFRIYRQHLKERLSPHEPRQRIHTMAIPLMAYIPLPAG